MKVKTIFILFFQIILFFFQNIKTQASTLDKIPSKYFSDKNFISMTYYKHQLKILNYLLHQKVMEIHVL